jgi:hypothetical protein
MIDSRWRNQDNEECSFSQDELTLRLSARKEKAVPEGEE